MLDQLDAKPEDFVHVSSHTRYDPMPMHDMGFRNLVLLDRGYDPVPPGYDLTVVKSLDELNTLLGIWADHADAGARRFDACPGVQ